jgi:hypothetical protein
VSGAAVRASGHGLSYSRAVSLEGGAPVESRPAQRAQAGKAPHTTGAPRTVIHHVSIAIDPIAEAALRGSGADATNAEPLRCDVCDTTIEGEAAGRGLYMWTRGDEVRFDEPALCQQCATAISVTALRQWDVEEEEG